MPASLSAILGRIETLAVDAVVNAANAQLLPGTGVDGALRAAAGEALTRATEKLAPVAPGEAVITPGFRAPARHIIHTVAPIWFLEGSESAKIDRLSRCYRSVIALAHEHELASVAFPCLGTGNFGWPRELARDTALEAVRDALGGAPFVRQVIFCCFSEADLALYRAVLA